MKVVLVHRDLHKIVRGGICTLYLALAEELVKAGIDVVLITQETPHPVQRAGMSVVTLPRTNDLIAHRAAVADALDRVGPDVIECSTWEAELLTYLARPRSARAPVLVRGDLSAATMNAADLARDEQQLCRRADAMVAVSQFAADDLASAYGIARPAVIANGVDRDRFTASGVTRPESGWGVELDRTGTVINRQPLNTLLAKHASWAEYFDDGYRDGRDRRGDGLVRLVWVGKFTQMKGFDRLQHVATVLGESVRILIVLGHGLVQYPVQLPPNVLVCQDLDTADLPAVYRRADYLLSTSRWEGYGLAIAEALACGTPALIPADLAAGAELVRHASTGYRYRDEDDLLQLLYQPTTLRGDLPSTFRWDRNAAATIKAYQGLLGAAATA
ncbi:glycosyltransferase family 4 protein [Kineosporia sp. J2-2]|uniref:Glycosyltransferase family 4 protein n=1 Tax=Kineosporia corallincola TaxID=2835133 RepID=A0ABS5TSC9_9ACTN|nr:glycosyltransferase family 4 protein [Kineosporia corallincola]MBT0773718.1 glycosyltransferase family 4 protein [Kineosporia corallincola]